MRILYVVPEGADMGGIITSTEQILQGFREVGHQADFALLRAVRTATREYAPPKRYVREFTKGKGSGQPVHPVLGWRGRYYALGQPEEFVRTANTYDVIVWGALYGLRNKITEGGDGSWLSVFSKVKKPHIAMVRDDHLPDRYPWAAILEKYIAGWACVQQASYDSCVGLVRPRLITTSGHDVRNTNTGKSVRERTVFSVQTFKSWKRVDKLVAAVPHLRTLRVVLAGDGIERRYMTSTDKCKPRYYCTKKTDPDALQRYVGKRIWDNAIQSGMTYLGPVSEEERDIQMQRAVLFVDMSNRNGTGQINRTLVEAMRNGCVPVVSPLFVGKHFAAGKDYLPIDPTLTPKEIARTLEQYATQNHRAMVNRNFRGLKNFDRKKAAADILSLVNCPPYKRVVKTDLHRKGLKMFEQIFNTKVVL